MRVLVLGAGGAGVATAYHLHLQGHEVSVVDRQAGPALETSFSNAGHVCPSYATPWAALPFCEDETLHFKPAAVVAATV